MKYRHTVIVSALVFALAGLGLSGCSVIGTETVTPSTLLEGEHLIYGIQEDEFEKGRNARFTAFVLRDGKVITHYSGDNMDLGDLQGMSDESIIELILDKNAQDQARSYSWIREQYGDETWPGVQEILDAVADSNQTAVGFMSSSDGYDKLHDDGCSNLEEGYAASYMVWGQQKTVDEVAQAFEKRCEAPVDRKAVEDSILQAVDWAAECVADESKNETMCDFNFAQKLTLYTEYTIIPFMREHPTWIPLSVGLTPDATGNAVQSESLYDNQAEEGRIGIYIDSAINPLDGQSENSVQGLEVYDSFYRFAWKSGGSEYYALRYSSRKESMNTIFALDELNLKGAEIWD